ncbi:MAG: phosphoadenosine phosphosulfate reductase family protein [Deltaproteobacteria bacterium]|nr:phosphoadenosine phosphosulfate reductase family protein [Deltaproteobacteria bacterium]
MYKVKWDSKINGILLDDKISDKEEIVPPRPVFYEELDLLGFNKYWSYPKKKEPLLWAIGRQYYNKGVFVAEAKGGNIYESPELIVEQELALEPIDVKLLIEKNEDALFIVENEAMDFVDYTYKEYKDKVDYFAVAFSGGKDSQVVLDIVSRVLSPDDYMVIFTDTTMEIPFTYETVERAKEAYKKTYPGLKFHTARPPKDALEFWEQFGPPGMLQRWCCSVCKTAPFANFIRDIHEGGDGAIQPKILVLEGVRADESDKRSKYKKITHKVKQTKQINAEPILHWNIAEIFLYLFRRNIRLNKGYRYGLHRIGCAVCPYGSNLYEYIITTIFPKLSNSFIEKIKFVLRNSETTKKDKIKKYISEGQWKKRGGGRGIDTNGTRLDFIQDDINLQAILRNPREDFFEWLKTLGTVSYRIKSNKIMGEIRIDSELFNFELNNIKGNKQVIQLQGVGQDIIIQSKLKKIFYKTTYCVHCGVCEVECPTGALRVIPQVKINKEMCVHCSKCLNFAEKGCLMAKSISVTEGGRKVKNGKIATSKYQNFGMRRAWLVDFLNRLENWFEKNNLGNRQIESMVAWLKDCELLNGHKVPTETSLILKEIIRSNEKLVWEIIWTNFFYNIKFIEWYVSNLAWNTVNSSKELIERIIDFDERNKPKTSSNSISSLLNMFDTSPLGKELKIGFIEKRRNVRYVRKIGTDEIHPMAIAYSLYRFAEDKKRYDLKVSDFYEDICEGGPYKLFGISRERLEDILRYLQAEKNETARVDLTAGLDNIFLREDITSVDILRILHA